MLPSKTTKHIIAVDLSGEEVVMLSEEGVVLMEGEEVLRSEGEGWCCLDRDKGVVVLGSFEGHLVVCTMGGNS